MQEYIPQPKKKKHGKTRSPEVIQQKDLSNLTKIAEGNVLKYNFIKIIETFKEEMRKSLKEIEENTNIKIRKK